MQEFPSRDLELCTWIEVHAHPISEEYNLLMPMQKCLHALDSCADMFKLGR